MEKIKKYPKKTIIYNKIKLFFDEKEDKIPYKDDLLYYLKLTNEDYINLESMDWQPFLGQFLYRHLFSKSNWR